METKGAVGSRSQDENLPNKLRGDEDRDWDDGLDMSSAEMGNKSAQYRDTIDASFDIAIDSAVGIVSPARRIVPRIPVRFTAKSGAAFSSSIADDGEDDEVDIPTLKRAPLSEATAPNKMDGPDTVGKGTYETIHAHGHNYHDLNTPQSLPAPSVESCFASEAFQLAKGDYWDALAMYYRHTNTRAEWTSSEEEYQERRTQLIDFVNAKRKAYYKEIMRTNN
jgi:hypothetical protein